VRRIYLAAVGLLVLVALALLGIRWWSEGVIATLRAKEGAPQRDVASAMGQWQPASLGDRFREGDGARTGGDQSAHFVLFTGARLVLKPSSQIRFLRNGGKGAVGLQVDMGEVDLVTERGRLTVDSQFGEIIVEANSTVSLRRNGARLTMAVQLGAIEFAHGTQHFSAGTQVELEVGGLVVESKPIAAGGAPVSPPAASDALPPLPLGDGVARSDLIAAPGTDITIHDPKPPTAVGFAVPKQCQQGVVVKVDRRRTQGRTQGNLLVSLGTHRYTLSCVESPETALFSGQLSVVKDTGQPPAPTFTPSATINTDGRKYTVLFQRELPKVTVKWPTAPAASRYTLSLGSRRLSSTSPTYSFSSGSLPAGTYQLVFSANTTPARQSRPTTLAILLDSAAPKGQLAEPRSGGFSPGEDVKIAGQALPGWKVSLGGEELPLDEQRRFTLTRRLDGTLPIAFSHPDRGIHYYLRRPGPSR